MATFHSGQTPVQIHCCARPRWCVTPACWSARNTCTAEPLTHLVVAPLQEQSNHVLSQLAFNLHFRYRNNLFSYSTMNFLQCEPSMHARNVEKCSHDMQRTHDIVHALFRTRTISRTSTPSLNVSSARAGLPSAIIAATWLPRSSIVTSASSMVSKRATRSTGCIRWWPVLIVH